MARVTIDTRAFEGEVRGLISRAADFRVPLKAWGVYMVGSVKKNFVEQGRPEKWKPLKIKTLIARYMRTAGAKKLQGKQTGGRFAVSNALFRKLGTNSSKSGDTAAVSTISGFLRSEKTGKVLRRGSRGYNKFAADGYAFRSTALKWILQGKILVDSTVLRGSLSRASDAVSGDARKVIIGTNVAYAGVHQDGSEKKKIPARPFLVIQPEDEAEFQFMLCDWLAGRWGSRN
jgi:phage gpG-like protein